MDAKEYLKGFIVAATGLAIVFGGARILEYSEAWCVIGNITIAIGTIIAATGAGYMYFVRLGGDFREFFKKSKEGGGK